MLVYLLLSKTNFYSLNSSATFLNVAEKDISAGGTLLMQAVEGGTGGDELPLKKETEHKRYQYFVKKLIKP